MAMTRGARSNRAYVATDSTGGTDLAFGSEAADRDQVLAGIMARRGAERSAHQQMTGLHRTRPAGISARQDIRQPRQQRSTRGISR